MLLMHILVHFYIQFPLTISLDKPEYYKPKIISLEKRNGNIFEICLFISCTHFLSSSFRLGLKLIKIACSRNIRE